MIRNLTVEFAAKRLSEQDADIERLLPYVTRGLSSWGEDGWWDGVVEEIRSIYRERVAEWGGQPKDSDLEPVTNAIERSLAKTAEPTEHTAATIAAWLAVMVENAAEVHAANQDEIEFVLQWVTMHDEKVRDSHRAVDGATIRPGEKFNVGGSQMPYPGFPVADLEQWINCRCTVAAVAVDAPIAASVPGEAGGIVHPGAQEETMAEEETQEPGSIGRPTEPMMWHGILAPEGVRSGDGRMFAEGSLSHRDLPLPLTWQKVQQGGHDGSVTVASIQQARVKDGLMYAQGQFLDVPEADEVIGLMSHFGRFGVSVDADAAEGEVEFDENDEAVGMTFSAARVCSASIVNIPAFAEAYVALGPWENGEMDESTDVEEPVDKELEDAYAAMKVGFTTTTTTTSDGSVFIYNGDPRDLTEYRDVSTDERKDLADKGAAMPDGSYPIANCSDLSNAIQAIGRAKDPAAVKAHIKKRKNALGCPDVALPEEWDSETIEFDRGPGWITDPIPTKRIHDYWTKPGEPGYMKIGWGVPGDFNRCRALVGEKIAENSPEDVRFLNQICAQWHHDALGFWPGRAPSEQSLTPESGLDGEPAPALSLVAGAGATVPHEWFANPQFAEPTPLTITPEGRVFGHAALWNTCHVGFEECVSPPTSASEYAYFLVGQVDTDAGPVPTGTLTIGAGHAPMGLRSRAAAAHYDDVSTAWAYVTCGEDEHGIWYSGMLAPGVSEDLLVDIKASKVSGDWRKIHGEYEMIAVHCVNSPGFPIPRVKVGMAAGEQVSMVASAEFSTMQEHLDRQGRPEEPAGRDLDDLAKKVVDEMEAREELRAQFAALKAIEGAL